MSNGIDVVVDFVTFLKEAKWLYNNLNSLNVKVVYIVLWTDKETLIERDSMRFPDERMGERSLILYDEFIKWVLDDTHFLNTSKNKTNQIECIVDTIIINGKFKLDIKERD